MSAPNLIKLGPAGDVLELSAFGRAYSEKWRLKYRDGEAASGKLRRQITARKKDVTLVYESADQATVDRLDYLMGLDGPFTMQVTHITTTKTYTVLMQPFERERLLAIHGGLWSGLSVEFNEV